MMDMRLFVGFKRQFPLVGRRGRQGTPDDFFNAHSTQACYHLEQGGVRMDGSEYIQSPSESIVELAVAWVEEGMECSGQRKNSWWVWEGEVSSFA